MDTAEKLQAFKRLVASVDPDLVVTVNDSGNQKNATVGFADLAPAQALADRCRREGCKVTLHTIGRMGGFSLDDMDGGYSSQEYRVVYEPGGLA
jgi:hypothetical protein